MTTTLAYPRADAVFNTGDKRDVCFGRLYDDGTQLDPTSFTLATTMQLVVGDAVTGDPIDALTATVVDDPDNAGKKAVLLRIDASDVDAGRWRWELHASGTVDSAALNLVPVGGYITIVDRLAEPS